MSERRAFFGTLALGGAQVAKYALQFAVLPVLARILGPSAYGVVALAMPFILFANMIADAGLGNALVRVQAPSRALQSTVFWLSAGMCAALALVIGLAAWPAGVVLHEPRLAPVLWALSPILLISGSLSVANAAIMRERRFGVFALSDTVSAAVASGIAIGAALAGLGAWSLVIQQLTLWTIKGAWIQIAARFLPSFECRPSLARPYIAFGLNAAASNVADFFAKTAPQVIVGAFLGVAAVGRYALAFQLVRVPDAVISGPIYLAAFTAVARLGDDHVAIQALTRRALRGVAMGLLPVFAGLALVADLAVQLMLGPKWTAAAPVMAVLCPAGFLLCYYSIVSAVLMGVGRADLQLRLTLLGGAAMGGGALLGARFGDVWVGVGLSAGAILVGPAYLGVLARALQARAGAIVADLAAPLAATAAMSLCVVLARAEATHWTVGAQFVLAVGAGALSYAVVLAVLSGRKMLEDLQMVMPRAARAELS